MHKYIYLTILLLGGIFTASSATTEEMEQARALAVKWTLRSLNTGSGYLDGTNPKSVSNLQNALKQKEKENLGKISMPMPSEDEYKSWDNAAMTNYWVNQFNSNVKSAEEAERNVCRGKLRTDLSRLSATVAATEKPAPTPEEKPAPEEEVQPEQPAPEVEEDINIDAMTTDGVDIVNAAPEEERITPPGTDGEREAAEGTKPLAKSGSNVWVIVMLIVLVLVMLVLVGYASNIVARTSNKRNQGNPRRNRREKDEEDDKREDLQVPVQKAPAQSYVADHQRARGREEIQEPVMPATSYSNQPGRPGGARITKPRIIYLSAANAEGVFLRAEAQYNMGNSIFKLVTSDGYSGSFSVIDDPTVHEMALMMPVDFLINACSGRNLQLSKGAHSIVTDVTGTAIFEGGRWRVARKAQIHYR